MFEGNVTFENVTFIIAIMSIAFSIYHFFRNPDIKNNTALQLLKAELVAQKELTSMAIKTMQNDVHSSVCAIEGLRSEVSSLKVEIAKLGAIIEERIAKKIRQI